MKEQREEKRFAAYVDQLCGALGHADRKAGLRGYVGGLLAPLERKSIEPLAAYLDPKRVQALHQALHHFVAKSEWSDEAVLEQVRSYVAAELDLRGEVYWMVDDTGFRKKGRHSVGVARQYCGEIGKQDNCQVAVSVSLGTAAGSVPMAWRLYLPQEWASDPVRRKKAGVPEDIGFLTKPEIALAQLRAVQAQGVPGGIVLADAAYGSNTEWRTAVAGLGLRYAVGVLSNLAVWPLGKVPEVPASGRGRPRTRPVRTEACTPQSVKALALALPAQAWQEVTWREGSNAPLRSRFAAVRVCDAHRDRLGAEEWLLIEWPAEAPEPIKYFLSNLDEHTSMQVLVHTAKARWRIERDYQDLKQEFGLDHYEGRGWRGFHHHATLCIAAYGFFVAQRLRGRSQKKPSERQKPALSEVLVPRGAAPARATPCP